MKKVLLTTALLFAFATTYAEDKVITDENGKTPISVTNKTDVKAVPVATVAMPTCYALSCDTFCDWKGEYSGCGDDIEALFNDLEFFYCW